MRLSPREMAQFGMLGAVMYASKVVMELLPNVHLLGTFTMAMTLAYGKKALYPLYTFVLICGLFNGFAVWWVPYLYVWTVLWGVTLLLPRNLPAKVRPLVYMAVCGLHGLLFGVLYAPAQALFFGLSLEQTIAWVLAGLPFDLMHGVSNFFCGLLILPLARIMERANTGAGYVSLSARKKP